MTYEDEPLPPPLDWDALAKGSPRPPSLLMEGLPRGKPTGVFGDGGLGKSYVELTRAVCLASGRPFFGVPMKFGALTENVLFLSCDDSEDDLRFRLTNICRYFDLDMASTRNDDLFLDVLDMTDRDAVLFDPRAPNGGLTPAYYRLRTLIREREVTTLFVDGIANTFAGNENDRGDVTRYVTAMHNLVRDSDTPRPETVVLIGHVNKVTAGNPVTAQGYSGSTAFNNRLRNRWFVRPEIDEGRRTGRILYELQKSNAGEVGAQMEFEWSDAHQMFVGRKREGSQTDPLHQDVGAAAAIRNVVKGCMEASPPVIVPAAMSGPNTAFHVLSRRPGFPPELRRDTAQARRRVNALLRELRETGHIVEKPYARANRKVGTQLVLTEEGLRQCA